MKVCRVICAWIFFPFMHLLPYYMFCLSVLLKLLLTFLFQNSLKLTRSCKNSTKSSLGQFTQLPPMLTSYITIVHCQDQETDVDIILLTQVEAIFRFHQFSQACFLTPLPDFPPPFQYTTHIFFTPSYPQSECSDPQLHH